MRAGNRVVADDDAEPMKERAIAFDRTGRWEISRLAGWRSAWADNHEIGSSKPPEISVPMALGYVANLKIRIIHS
jgi:hypothetical protein